MPFQDSKYLVNSLIESKAIKKILLGAKNTMRRRWL